MHLLSFVRPLEIFRFAPGRFQLGVVVCYLAPLPDWSGPYLGRRLVAAPDERRDFAVAGECEIRKIAEGVKTFRRLPKGADGVVGHVEFRNGTAASDILGEENALRRLPEE